MPKQRPRPRRRAAPVNLDENIAFDDIEPETLITRPAKISKSRKSVTGAVTEISNGDTEVTATDFPLTNSARSNFLDLNQYNIEELPDEERQSVFRQVDDIFHQADDLERRLQLSIAGKEVNEIHQQMSGEITQMRKQAISIQQQLLRKSDVCSYPGQLECALRESLLLHQKNTNDIESLEERLKTNCRLMGLRFKGSTPRNGNCFFEAVSSQLNSIGLEDKSPNQLRQEVVEYLKHHKIFQGNDGPVHIEQFMSGTFQNWCIEMKQNGVFADHVLVLGMAQFLQTDIMIVTSSPRGGLEHNVTWITGKEGFAGTPILLGHYWENHYQSLEPKLDTLQVQTVYDKVFDGASKPTEDCAETTEEYECNNDIQTCYNDDNKEGQDPFIQFIQKRFCKKPEADGVKRIIQKVRHDEEDQHVMEKFLHKSKLDGWGNFSQCHANKTTVQWFCERHMAPKGRKKGPLQTRANACPAYISFKIVSINQMKAVIIRTKIHHDGHNPLNEEERKVAPIDEELKAYIFSLMNQDKKTHQILLACEKWSKDRGHNDFRDRQCFPTPKDIKYYAERFRSCKRKYERLSLHIMTQALLRLEFPKEIKKILRYHKNDAIAVDYLCTVLLKENIVFYQPKKDNEQQPLVIIYQNAKQQARMAKFGQNVVFLDATYKGVTAYGYALYCLLARDDRGHGTPLAFMVTSDDDSDVITIFLNQLKISAEKQQIVFEPRSFMVDKDLKEKKAINEVFPRSAVLLCWFHVLQAIYRWLNRQVSGVSGSANATKRQEIVNYVREMRMCTKEQEFEQLSTNIDNIMPPAVANYLRENWTNIGHQWSNYGRPFFHEDHNTNNLVERFFLGMKYHFLGGYGNTRVEELLLLLDGEVTSLFNYMEELALAGRLGSNTRKNNGKEEAIKLLKNGYAGFLEWITDTTCLVPSTKNMSVKYKVDIIRATCECLAATNYGLCKHVHVAFDDAAQRGKSLEHLRKEKAVEIVNDGIFYIHGDGYMDIFDKNGDVGMVNTHNHKCLCVAYSHNIKCVCLLVEEIANKALQESNDEITTNQAEVDCQMEVDNNEAKNNSLRHNLQSKIEDIYKWANSAEMESSLKNPNILEQVDILHRTIFGSFAKRTKKRKIHALHPYKKTLAMKKNKNNQVENKDYLYCGENPQNTKKSKSQVNKNTLPDGSFKRKNRSGHCVRSPFD